jgi:Subtilase family
MLTAATRRARPGFALRSALTMFLALSVITATSPASADSVRSAQEWVLTAVNAPAAWNVTKGQGVVVAVIDSGVNPAVSDLSNSVIGGPDLTGVGTPPSNPGWGMHGTWMASLIAGHGHGGGGDGITGIAPQARVLSIRVITDKTDPGYARYQREQPSRGQRQLAKAIRYAVSKGAGVISMSLGYSTSSLAVRQALQDALDHNVVVVASSGNSGGAAGARGKGHAPYSFPADYPGVLGVAAVNQAGQPAAFSSENLSVQVAAPGVDVPAQGRDGQYWLVSGTSPACALTAGVAALIRSRYPGLPPAMVRRAIIGTTRNRPPGGYDDNVGFGTVNAGAALAAAGRLAGHVPHQQGLVAGHRYGGGAAAVPPAPIRARGAGTLALLCLLGVACLALMVAAARRLVMIRRGSLPTANGGGEIVVGVGPLSLRHPAGAGRSNGGAYSGAARSDGTYSDGADSDGTDSDGAHSAGAPPGRRSEDGSRTSVLPRFTWQPGPTGRHVAQPDQGAAEDGE